MKTYKGKSYGNARYTYLVLIKVFIKTMQHCMLHRWRYVEGKWEKELVPGHVEEGHFIVVAVKCEKPKRFMVKLGCLTNPGFLRLLKKSGEEYGFKHEGAIAIPCEPEVLQTILQEMTDE